MKKLYQKFTDHQKGDNLQATIACLFDKEIEEVPYFEPTDDIMENINNFINPLGYELIDAIVNKKYHQLLNPLEECFEENEWDYSKLITPGNIAKYEGVNGFFMASVLCPQRFSWESLERPSHAVIVDKAFNIVHDTNPDYKGIRMYPLEHHIGYRGITHIFLINKIKK